MAGRIFIIMAVILGLSRAAEAEAAELAFQEAWKIIASESKAQKASNYELEAAEEAKSRSKLHWLPRVYVDAKGYQTNDPGMSFFGTLSQRSVTAADFNPASLNHPESRWYTRGAIGLDLPLFEGGMKAAQVEMQGHFADGKRNSARQAKVGQFAEVAHIYGSLIGLGEQREKLESLNSSLDRLLKAYRIGDRSNQVGYSGLLGLKTLQNRLQGLLAENRASMKAQRAALEEMGLRREGWVPEKVKVQEFIQRAFASERRGESAATGALKGMALASEARARMEKARYLPRVGVFAEEYLFSGSRKTDNGFSAGLYLRWNLFSAEDYGIAKEASLSAAAFEMQALAAAEQEKAELRGASEAIEAVRENLELMEGSEALLEEQTKIAESLFRNGSINALQLVEVLSRRADLIVAHNDAKLSSLKLHAERARKTDFEIPGNREGAGI